MSKYGDQVPQIKAFADKQKLESGVIVGAAIVVLSLITLIFFGATILTLGITVLYPAAQSIKAIHSEDKNDDKENEIDSSTDDMEVRVVPTKEKKEIPVADLTHDADDVLTESILEKEDASDEVIAYEIPERVLSAKKTKTDGILFLCEWKERKDGSKLKDCYITNEAMITYFPSLLIKFYQDKHFSN